MAVCRNIVCSKCHQEREVWFSAADYPPDVCYECIAAESVAKKKQALAEIAALPIEQRMARIEEWIYDYKPQYVSPPMIG